VKYDRLLTLYNETGKHSQYQIPAKVLSNLLPVATLNIRSRFEQERLDYILRHIECRGAQFTDIGGNTGFFTFEMIDHGADFAIFIEGNPAHSAFVEEAARVLKWQDQIRVYSQYFDFGNDLDWVDSDICFLLNVLHHVGDDYGRNIRDVDSAKANILLSLKRLAKHVKQLVFQLGFNWQGNIEKPLFQHGTKKELIRFLESGIRDDWSIQNIGIAERRPNGIVYKDANSANIERDDSLGEFLNRPIFIMRSRKIQG